MAASGCAARHTGAQRPRRAAPCAERVARGGDQASRRRRARSARAIGAERVARGGASWRSQRQHTLGGLCLLANSNKKGSPALALAHDFFLSVRHNSVQTQVTLTAAKTVAANSPRRVANTARSLISEH